MPEARTYAEGDEVITCAFGSLAPDSYGRHRHDDSCFEVRQIERTCTEPARYLVSDLIDGTKRGAIAGALRPAPAYLLARKTEFFHRLVKICRAWEQWEQVSALALLERIAQEADRYLFVSEAVASRPGPPETGPLASREAFESVAGAALTARQVGARYALRPHNTIKLAISTLNNALPPDQKLPRPY